MAGAVKTSSVFVLRHAAVLFLKDVCSKLLFPGGIRGDGCGFLWCFCHLSLPSTDCKTKNNLNRFCCYGANGMFFHCMEKASVTNRTSQLVVCSWALARFGFVQNPFCFWKLRLSVDGSHICFCAILAFLTVSFPPPTANLPPGALCRQPFIKNLLYSGIDNGCLL